MTLRRWAAAALLGAILLTGCSSDKKKDESASPATTAAAAAPSTTRRIIGGPFCEFALTFNGRYAQISPSLADPQQLRAAFEQAAKAIDDAEQIAPAEVRPDVRVLATQFRDLVVILQQANYDFSKVPQASIQRLQSPEVQAAGQRLDAYVKQNCRTA